MLNFTGIGAVIGWSMSGHIIEEYGWKYAFYVAGIIIGIYTVLLLIFIYDSPNKHPRIMTKERKYILSKLNTTVAGKKVISLIDLHFLFQFIKRKILAMATFSSYSIINSILGAGMFSLWKYKWL